MRNTLLVALALLLIGLPASAGVIIVADPIITMNAVDDYTWSYDVYLAPNSTLNPPGTPCTAIVQGGICDGLLTIFDFAGYIGGSIGTSAAGWTSGTVQLTGITPAGIVASDDPGIFNLSWAYLGNSSIQAPPTASTLLGTFEARSVFNRVTVDDYAGRTSTASGLRSANLDVTNVPDAVPEPGTIFLFGSALLAFAYTARRRKLY